MKSEYRFTAKEVVAAMYMAALGRKPDEAGLHYALDVLGENPGNLMKLAHGIFSSDERRSASGASGAFEDHSQFGEVPLLVKSIVNSASKYKTVVDVGARGRDRSNSYDLLKDFGWQGLLIEANPALQASIKAEFSGTRFVAIQCAIGPEEGTLPFYIGTNDDVSSLRKDAAQGWGDIRGQVDVDVRRLHKVLADHEVPKDFDLLSLDIEGMDVEVFNDLLAASPYRPTYVIVEASYDYKTKTLADAGFSDQVQREYRIIEQTQANLILAKA